MAMIKKVISVEEIRELLEEFDAFFIPKISQIVDNFHNYSLKLFHNSNFYKLINSNLETIGILSFYDNNNFGFLILIAVIPGQMSKGLGTKLLNFYESKLIKKGLFLSRLEVSKKNNFALSFYIKKGYKISEHNILRNSVILFKNLIQKKN